MASPSSALTPGESRPSRSPSRRSPHARRSSWQDPNSAEQPPPAEPSFAQKFRRDLRTGKESFQKIIYNFAEEVSVKWNAFSRKRRRASTTDKEPSNQPAVQLQPRQTTTKRSRRHSFSHIQNSNYQYSQARAQAQSIPPTPSPLTTYQQAPQLSHQQHNNDADSIRPAKRQRLSEAREPPTPAVFASRRNSSGLAAALAAPLSPGLTYVTEPKPLSRPISTNLPFSSPRQSDAAAIRAAVVPPRTRPSAHVMRASSMGPLASHASSSILPQLVLATPQEANQATPPSFRHQQTPEVTRTHLKTPAPKPARRLIRSASRARVFEPGKGRTPVLPPSNRTDTQKLGLQVLESGHERPLSPQQDAPPTIEDLRKRKDEIRRDEEAGKVHERMFGERLASQKRVTEIERDCNQKVAKLRDIELRIQANCRIRAEQERELQGLKDIAESADKQGPERPDPKFDHWENVYWEFDDDDWYDTEELGDESLVTVIGDGRSSFAPLTERAMKLVRRTLGDFENEAKLLAEIDGCQIRGEELRRLRPNCWLNDEVINAYMLLLEKRSSEARATKNGSKDGSKGHIPNGIGKQSSEVLGIWPKVKIMNSFFYARLVEMNKRERRAVYNYMRVRRWTKRFDAFGLDIMLIPINQDNLHWTLGVIDFRNKTVQHFDSLGTGGSPKVREYLLNWVADEAKDKGKLDQFDRSAWQAVESDVPVQRNTDDCGVFLCKFADFLSRGWSEFTFSQTHMKYFRCRIAHELLAGKVL